MRTTGSPGCDGRRTPGRVDANGDDADARRCDPPRAAATGRSVRAQFQAGFVFDDTGANNIHLWQGDVDEDPALRERIIHAAERAHADHFIRELPNGYRTVVGDRGVRLSGGQRQRLFVARELFKQPNLLLLDEATSDLDTASEQHIQSSIDALKGEVTVVIIAHRLSTVKNADRVYVLDEGRVIEEGAYHELRAREDGARGRHPLRSPVPRRARGPGRHS